MSRLVNNQIWNARSFANLSVEDKLLFLYLETSPETNYYGVFVLPPDSVISARTGLSLQKVKSSLDELQRQKKICLVDDYLIIFNYFDKQLGEKSEKTLAGLEKFKKSLPYQVLEVWSKGGLSPLEGGIEGVSSPHEEKKDKIKINIKEKKDKIKEIKEFYNSTFSKNILSSVSWEDNASFWLEFYSLEQIKKAIANIDHPSWWANKPKNGENPSLPTLDLLFRTKNKTGKCDYINQILSLGEKPVIRKPDYDFSHITQFSN